MSERIFTNTNDLPAVIITRRLAAADPDGTARTYEHVSEEGAILRYVAVDSILTDAQIENGLANPITASEQAAIDRYKAAKDEAALAAVFRNLTPAQAEAYIQANVTDLASAKAALKVMARLLIAICNRVLPDLPEG